MELSKNYLPTPIESKWYEYWLSKNYFASTPDDREPYTVVIPPPNVTGVLHMGHCLNNTIQDILIRRARMQGKNACWVPGTDHASIATEAKVVAMLRERGITKSSLSREEFLNYAWEWKEKYGGIILQQLRKMGCSLDWDRTSFTMDPDYYQSVIQVFNDLYKKGHIYRGKRMINWDVRAKTALSDEEVIYKEVQSKLYYVNYVLEDGGNITIATVRPETILGDAAICVNPNDERYKHLHGKFAFVPLIKRKIKIIPDEYVTLDFGTGALKVTPAHDMNDYQLGQKYQLEIIDIMNDDGTMSEAAQLYIGEDRFEVRKKIVADLTAAGHIQKIEEYTNQVGFSERTDVVVEPRLSLQWWVSMKELATPALSAVMNDEIHFHPAKFKNLYRHWMENIKDWCISRQLWWGHRIPAWYTQDGTFAVASNAAQALAELKTITQNDQLSLADIRQDDDCLDTWFSSWLWPFEVFKGLSDPGNKEVNYYYPTNTLVTAPEIIFFWVARMIMAGYEYKQEKPFKDVYFTGIVRDKQGRKMSKSLGNSPDLLGLIDVYGADAVRFGIMIASPAGNDILFDESALEQGRNFNNKLWNALKLLKMWEARAISSPSSDVGNAITTTEGFAINWFENRLNQAAKEVDELLSQFKLSEALKTLYSLIWDDFCSWYLEWVKPGFEQPIDAVVYHKTVNYFERLMEMLHPFMPFITEEIYHLLKVQSDDLCVKQFQQIANPDNALLHSGEILKQVITALRDARNKNQIKPKDLIQLYIQTQNPSAYQSIESILMKQVNAASINYTDTAISNTILVNIENDKFYIEAERELDTAAIKEGLLKDLAYEQNFLASVMKKLDNEKFVANAKPEVIALERKKQSDAEARIKTIQESLQGI